MTHPDKGRGVFISDEFVYVEKMEEIVSDPAMFLEITKLEQNKLTRQN